MKGQNVQRSKGRNVSPCAHDICLSVKKSNFYMDDFAGMCFVPVWVVGKHTKKSEEKQGNKTSFLLIC